MITTRLDLRAYAADGFAVADAVFSPAEVDAIRAEIDRMWAKADSKSDGVHWRDHATLGRIADRLDPVRTRSVHMDAVGRSEKLLGLAEDLLGGPVFVLKDKVIMKRPGTAGYGVHQDYAYWDKLGLKADQVLTAMIALDDVTPAHGPVALYAGLHAARLPADPADPLDVDPASLAGHDPYLATVKAGDVVFFHALAPHSSGENRSSGSRRVYQITFARAVVDIEQTMAAYAQALPAIHMAHAPRK